MDGGTEVLQSDCDDQCFTLHVGDDQCTLLSVNQRGLCISLHVCNQRGLCVSAYGRINWTVLVTGLDVSNGTASHCGMDIMVRNVRYGKDY